MNNQNEVQLAPTVELPTEAAINIRNFFGKTTAALDEIGLPNIVALENSINNAIIHPKSLLEKVTDEEVKVSEEKETDA